MARSVLVETGGVGTCSPGRGNLKAVKRRERSIISQGCIERICNRLAEHQIAPLTRHAHRYATAPADRFQGIAFRLMFALYCIVLGILQRALAVPRGAISTAEETSVVCSEPRPHEITDYDNSTALSNPQEVP